MLRTTVALVAVLIAAGAARADRAAPPVDLAWFQLRGGVATGDAAKIAGALAAPLRYEGVAFTDDACARTFGVSGTVKAAKLKRFAACLTNLLGAHAVDGGAGVTVSGEVSTGSHPLVNRLVVRYAIAEADPAADDDVNGVEGGIEGGVVGGVPPPPPPPAPPLIVSPAAVNALIVTGSTKVVPSAKAVAAIRASGKARVVTPVKLCFSVSGVPYSAMLYKSSGFPIYDAEIVAGFKAIRIRPFEVNGHATPVCSSITLIYSQP